MTNKKSKKIVLKEIEAIMNFEDEGYPYRDTLKVNMMTDDIEALFILKFVTPIWKMGGMMAYRDSIVNGGEACAMEVSFFPIGAICPNCMLSIRITDQFVDHARKLALKFMVLNGYGIIDKSEPPPRLEDILSMLKSGELAGKFDYECPGCDLPLTYETFTSEVEMRGEEHLGILDTNLTNLDDASALENAVGFIIINDPLFSKMWTPDKKRKKYIQ